MTGLSVRERTLRGVAYIPEDRQDVGLVLDFDLAQNLTLRDYFQEPYCKKGVLDRTGVNFNVEDSVRGDYDQGRDVYDVIDEIAQEYGEEE